jgi:3-phosphoshikimate 1-carboxyvinyltransferase
MGFYILDSMLEYPENHLISTLSRMEKLHLEPRSRFSGTLMPPGSKSIANRALPLAALAGATLVGNLPDGDDVVLMQKALAALGAPLSGSGMWDYLGENLTPDNRFKAPEGGIALHLGNSGTATRILTALLAAGEGVFRIDGVARMRERPIGDLVEALLPLCGGTRIAYEGKPGFPPLRIDAKGLAGGKTRIRGNLSSQFVTGLLMAMPLCRGPVEVEIEGALVSAPYVDLTLKVMEAIGATVSRDGYKRFWIDAPRGYKREAPYAVEPDASSASYFLAGAAIAGGPVTVNGIDQDSGQGEAGFARKLAEMGARVAYEPLDIRVEGTGTLRGIEADMDLMSDTGMTLAIVALFAEGRTVIRNVGNWRLKETDRLRAMATELRKLGATVEEGPDWISIDPPAALVPDAVIETYDDHRMAMCFSLVTLGPRGVPVTILDPGCVSKTYPRYFEDFAKLAGA